VCVDKTRNRTKSKKVISIEYGIRTVMGGHDSNGEGGEGGGVWDGGQSTGGGGN
jgi:hypothetical protein